MKKHWHIKFLTGLCIFLLGIITSKYVNNWPFIELKNEVDVFQSVVSLFSLVATVSLAYWVTQKLEKAKESDRIEKDLFIVKFGELYALIEEVELSVSKTIIDYPTVIADFKRMNRKSAILFKHLTNSALNIDAQLKPGAFGKIRIVKDLLTLTPVNNSVNPPVTIVNNEITLSPSRRREVNLAFDDLKNDVFNIELCINKADA